MRIDKYFSSQSLLSRSECQKAIRRGEITVNGERVIKCDAKIDPEKDVIELNGKVINYKKYVYIAINKPFGVVSATEDARDKTVLDLLPSDMNRTGLFPCGRLDKDTVGLVIVTNDGAAAHRNLSPKRHVKKKYYFECAEVLSKEDVSKLESGILLKDGYKTKPCELLSAEEKSGYITLTEGKYHEIKRMFGALGNKITFLERVSFKNITLNKDLKRGEWRYLTEEEITDFIS